jgi:OpgC protein
VLISVPLTYPPILRAVPWLAEFSGSLGGLKDKTGAGILRYVHFLALAYLAWVAVGEGGRRLVVDFDAGWPARAWGRTVSTFQKVGQQSLAVFVCSMIAARIFGFGLDLVGPTLLTVTIANIVGFGFLIFVAYLVAWFKSQPWRTAR